MRTEIRGQKSEVRGQRSEVSNAGSVLQPLISDIRPLLFLLSAFCFLLCFTGCYTPGPNDPSAIDIHNQFTDGWMLNDQTEPVK